jgi:metal-sulfur cluster biosynthetic enzyme/rhodanese-related sulfurtransferase
MTVAALIVGLVLGGIVWRLALRVRAAERQVRELRLLGRELQEVRDDARRGLAVTRAHLAAVAAGAPPERDAILRGAPFRDVQPAEALALWERGPDLFVLDVRTPAEFAHGHIPRSRLIPLDELEDRLAELPSRDAPILVHCAVGGRSAAACELLGRHGWTELLNLAGGMNAWEGPRVTEESSAASAPAATGTEVAYRGGPVTGAQVIDAIRECYDPEIPVNVYDLGLIYGIDIDESAIAIRMTLTSEGCPSARTIPEDVRRRVAALGQSNVRVDVVWEPPWHPSRISSEGRQKLGMA